MNANTPHADIDNAIDHALTALRDAQPRTGFNGRILTSLEHRAEAAGGPSFRTAKGWDIVRGSERENPGRLTHLALWAATAAAILAIASMTILHYRVERAKNAVILSEASHRDPNTNAVILSEQSESKNPDTVSQTTNPEPFSTTNLARIPHTVSSRPEDLSRHPEWSALARSRGTPVFENAATTEPQDAVATTPTDAQLLADLHAPSHPAPPLPLTAEEKLFRRTIRYRNATQLAELDPIVRAKENAEETTAFKAFFPDPPPLQQPGDTE
jgi:hypothetical protein